MSRRRRHSSEEHVNHERWLVSYADFITLMFAFFVVLFAYSQSDKDKARLMSSAIQESLTEGRVSSKIQAMFNASPNKRKGEVNMAELSPQLEELKTALDEDIRKGRVQVSLEGRGLVISLKQAAFFPTGDSTVAPGGYASLEKVAETLRKIPNSVRLEGHTDSIPISNGRFSSNWELSAARSIAMLDLLSNRLGISKQRLAVVGYGDTIPVDTNDTEEGRARNRRVDITVLKDVSLRSEPSKKQ